MIRFPNKKYSIIYADPPWSYPKSGGISNGRGLAKKHYPTMSLIELKKLPISDIACDNCYLFMWATYPKLCEALETISAWDFEYFTTAFTWIKKNKKTDSLFWGMGTTTRANAEIVLLARKGKLQRINAGVHSVVQSPIEGHSKKPNEVRDRIVQLYGDLPKIELFARERHTGWDAWGNEV